MLRILFEGKLTPTLADTGIAGGKMVWMLLMLAALAGDEAWAQAYKCVDGNGRTSYSDRPCDSTSRQQKALQAPGVTATSPPAALPPAASLPPRVEGDLSEGQRREYSSRFYRVCMNGRAHSEAFCRCMSGEAASRAHASDYRTMMTLRGDYQDRAELQRLVEASGDAA